MDNIGVGAESEQLRGRARSSSTLTTLYHQTRQELELLNKQIYMKDSIIADLRVQLGTYERTYMTVGDAEPVQIGQTKSLLESLCEEIYILKHQRDEAELKASSQTEAIQQLHVQLREKEQELERIRCQPEHKKDQEIQRLQTALVEKDQSEATRAVLCTSLAEEADQLRGQLSATVKVCQELLVRLERERAGGRGGGDGEVEEMGQQKKSKETTESTNLHSQRSQLQAENRQLKQRVAYVEGLNAKWQKYDASREDYIRTLCQRIKETSGNVACSSRGGGMANEQGFGAASGPFSTAVLHQEIARLNRLLQEKIGEYVKLEQDMEVTCQRSQERIQTLEQQVLIYAEDFKSERADRERAQGLIQDLREEIAQMKKQLQKQGTIWESRDVAPLCCVHIGHRIASRHVPRAGAETQKQTSAAVPSPAWNEGRDLSELQCPRCLTTFDDRNTVEYLNHCEECARL